jgi:hypothetical protein
MLHFCARVLTAVQWNALVALLGTGHLRELSHMNGHGKRSVRGPPLPSNRGHCVEVLPGLQIFKESLSASNRERFVEPCICFVSVLCNQRPCVVFDIRSDSVKYVQRDFVDWYAFLYQQPFPVSKPFFCMAKTTTSPHSNLLTQPSKRRNGG